MSGGVEDVNIWNCDLEESNTGITIKTNAARGGYVKNVKTYNCILTGINVESVNLNNDGESAPNPSLVGDLSFEKITVTGVHHMTNRNRTRKGNFVSIVGYEGDYKVKNVTLKDIKLKHNLLSPYNDFVIKNCENVRIENVESISL